MCSTVSGKEQNKVMTQNKRTYIFLGSSVTHGADGRSMCEYLAQNCDADIIKWAVPGTTLSDQFENSYVARLRAAIGEQESCDHFICQLSTNDAGRCCALGTVSASFDAEDFDVNTVIGAMEYIIASAKARWRCPVSFYTGTYFESAGYAEMVKALLKLSEKWGIGVIDLYNDDRMRDVSEASYRRWMRDPVHPTWEGYCEWWGPRFLAYLENA